MLKFKELGSTLQVSFVCKLKEALTLTGTFTMFLLISGCWDDEVLQVIVKYLVIGNFEVRQDLILNMIDGKNVQYVNKVSDVSVSL